MQIESAHEDGTVVFQDGSSVHVDVILHCTGYVSLALVCQLWVDQISLFSIREYYHPFNLFFSKPSPAFRSLLLLLVSNLTQPPKNLLSRNVGSLCISYMNLFLLYFNISHSSPKAWSVWGGIIVLRCNRFGVTPALGVARMAVIAVSRTWGQAG